ncbi:unnamed protein product, partial [Chrysoparadoxa australica]
PTPRCLLYVCAKGANDLKNVQLVGRQDPYLKLWAGPGGQTVKTKVCDNGGKRAVWDESFMFSVEKCLDDSLYFEIKNKNITDSTLIGYGK